MFCPNCGSQIADEAVICVKCGASVGKSYADMEEPGQDAVTRMLIPIGRSGWAIAAGYMGLLSLIPFFGIFALILGLVALNDIKKHPDKHGKGRAWFGVVMGIIATILTLIILCATLFGI